MAASVTFFPPEPQINVALGLKGSYSRQSLPGKENP